MTEQARSGVFSRTCFTVDSNGSWSPIDHLGAEQQPSEKVISIIRSRCHENDPLSEQV